MLELAQLDTEATAADPDGAGPLTSGYDDDFKEPVRLPVGTTSRKEKPLFKMPVQVEVTTYEQLNQKNSGNDPNTRLAFVFHFEDLEDLGLLDVNGNAMIRTGDRAVAVYRMDDETLIMRLGLQGQGMFCTEVQPQSFGLSGGERNLLVCTFENRQQSYSGGG